MNKEISRLGRGVKRAGLEIWGLPDWSLTGLAQTLSLPQANSAFSSMKISVPSPPSKGLEVISFNRLKWPLTACLAHSRQTVNISCSPPFCTKLNPSSRFPCSKFHPPNILGIFIRAGSMKLRWCYTKFGNRLYEKSPPQEACYLAREDRADRKGQGAAARVPSGPPSQIIKRTLLSCP